MPDKQPMLEYGKPAPRYSLRRFSSVLSIVIGIGVTVISLCCFWAIGGYDTVDSFILRFAFDDHWVLFLPPLAIIGVVGGIIAWTKGRSTASIFGIVLSMIAFFASMGVSAIERLTYFMRH